MAKDFEMGYLLDFYGEVLTPKQREMLNQYYNDDLSLSEIGENFGITRQGARNCEYDTVGKVSPSLYAGYLFTWGKKNEKID